MTLHHFALCKPHSLQSERNEQRGVHLAVPKGKPLNVSSCICSRGFIWDSDQETGLFTLLYCTYRKEQWSSLSESIQLPSQQWSVALERIQVLTECIIGSLSPFLHLASLSFMACTWTFCQNSLCSISSLSWMPSFQANINIQLSLSCLLFWVRSFSKLTRSYHVACKLSQFKKSIQHLK